MTHPAVVENVHAITAKMILAATRVPAIFLLQIVLRQRGCKARREEEFAVSCEPCEIESIWLSTNATHHAQQNLPDGVSKSISGKNQPPCGNPGEMDRNTIPFANEVSESSTTSVMRRVW